MEHAHRSSILARDIAHPLLRLTLLKIRTVRVSVGGGFITRLGIGGMPFLLPLLYQLGLGMPPWQSGLMMMPAAAAAMGMKFLSTLLLRRYGFRTILVVNTMLVGSSMATSIASTLQQLSLGFGLAFGSIIAGLYLGGVPQTEQLAVTKALHYTFLTVGALTMVSSLAFWTLRPGDGDNVSRGKPATAG